MDLKVTGSFQWPSRKVIWLEQRQFSNNSEQAVSYSAYGWGSSYSQIFCSSMEKSIPDSNFAAKMNPFPKSQILWYGSSSLVSQQRLRTLLDPHIFSWTSDQGSSVNKTKGKIELKRKRIDFKMTQVTSQTKYLYGSLQTS